MAVPVGLSALIAYRAGRATRSSTAFSPAVGRRSWSSVASAGAGWVCGVCAIAGVMAHRASKPTNRANHPPRMCTTLLTAIPIYLRAKSGPFQDRADRRCRATIARPQIAEGRNRMSHPGGPGHGPGEMIGSAGPGMLAGLRVIEVADERAEYA